MGEKGHVNREVPPPHSQRSRKSIENTGERGEGRRGGERERTGGPRRVREGRNVPGVQGRSRKAKEPTGMRGKAKDRTGTTWKAWEGWGRRGERACENGWGIAGEREEGRQWGREGMAGRAGDCENGSILNITLTLAYPQDLAPGLHFVPQSPVSQWFASIWARTGSATTTGETKNPTESTDKLKNQRIRIR